MAPGKGLIGIRTWGLGVCILMDIRPWSCPWKGFGGFRVDGLGFRD